MPTAINAQNETWTQYQKLVLAELERHDDRQSSFEKEIVELKLAQARLALELGTLNTNIRNLSIDLKDLAIEFKKTNTAISTQQVDISALKIKMTIWCSAISIIASSAVAAIFKFFLMT